MGGAAIEMADDHYYNNPGFFFDHEDQYDKTDRKGPKIYVGEYAVNSGVGRGNLLGALAEAAFLMGWSGTPISCKFARMLLSL